MDIDDVIYYLNMAALMHKQESMYYECGKSGDSAYDAGGVSLHKNISDAIYAALQIIESKMQD